MIRKKKPKLKITAISLLLLSLLLIFSTVSFAATTVGRVTHLSGPLFAKKADGTTRVLSINSSVEQGDTLVTKKRTYARIKFTDNSEMTLRPNTQFKVSQYNFDKSAPRKDNAVFNLVRGGVRSLTGMIGKRGDQDSYRLITPTAVAGVRGTTYECKICEGNCGSLPDGVYFFIAAGSISVSNSGGSQTFSAGQYAYVATATSMPTILPKNPGIDFTLPVSIGDTSKEGGGPKDSGCVVR
jgi:FecR protein